MELPKVKARGQGGPCREVDGRPGRAVRGWIPGHGISGGGWKKCPLSQKMLAPILFKNCLRCHGPEGIASRVPLTSYEAVQSRAEKIKEKVMTRQMPPWPAEPAKSVKFRNDARLSQQDIDTIVAWVRAGHPQGRRRKTFRRSRSRNLGGCSRSGESRT